MNYALQCSETPAKRTFSSCCSYVMFTKAAQVPKKNNQDMQKTCTNTRKTKKKQQLWAQDSGLVAKMFVFSVFLVPVQVSSTLHFVFFAACTGFVSIPSSNMHRHQKNKKTNQDMHQTCTGTKKTKTTQTSRSMDPRLLTSCQNVCFFCLLWCLCRFP